MITIINESTNELFYATQDSAGFDIPANEPTVIEPGEIKLVGTGLRIDADSLCTHTKYITSRVWGVEERIIMLPELQIRSRSGLASKGICVANGVGTVDCQYLNEIKVVLINHSKQPFQVTKGMRIAQGVCSLIVQIPGIEVKPVVRGMGGFGSTGV